MKARYSVGMRLLPEGTARFESEIGGAVPRYEGVCGLAAVEPDPETEPGRPALIPFLHEDDLESGTHLVPRKELVDLRANALVAVLGLVGTLLHREHELLVEKRGGLGREVGLGCREVGLQHGSGEAS